MKLCDLVLTEKLLHDLGACKKSFDFVKRNNLFGFPISRLHEIQGDYEGYVRWLSFFDEIFYDAFGNVIYCEGRTERDEIYWEEYQYDCYGNCVDKKTSFNYWEKFNYDCYGNCIYWVDSKNFWVKNTYDEFGNLVYYETSSYSEKNKYDKCGNNILVEYSDGLFTEKNYNEFGNLIWVKERTGNIYEYEYDSFGNIIIETETSKENTICWQKFKYDLRGNLIYYENSLGCVEEHTTSYYDSGQLRSIDDMIIPEY